MSVHIQADRKMGVSHLINWSAILWMALILSVLVVGAVRFFYHPTPSLTRPGTEPQAEAEHRHNWGPWDEPKWCGTGQEFIIWHHCKDKSCNLTQFRSVDKIP